MTWSSEIVRARFVEAADTERRLPTNRVTGKSGFWPAYEHTFEDMNGWGTPRLAEEREMRLRRTPPSAAAISRHLEVVQWTGAIIAEDRRRLVWAWASCQVSGRSFSEHCRRKGLVKVTAYRRLSAVWSIVSSNLSKNNTLLRLPDEKWLLQDRAGLSINSHTLAIPDDEPGKVPTFQVFDGAKAAHTLTTPEAVDAFERHLAEVNRARRREQRRREKLGAAK